MDKRCKFSPERKLEIARKCCKGELSVSEASRLISADRKTVRDWIVCYQKQGADGFFRSGRNKGYSLEIKLQAVRDYLDGKGSYQDLAAKYGLRASQQLRQWVKMYNSGKGLKNNVSGGSRMIASRKTTKEERLAIVEHCLSNGQNYSETAIKYNVSYQQVYNWVKRFSELGEAGLEDRRGRRRVNQEPRSEAEKLTIKVAQLEHELYTTKMERDLLKKVDELERRDVSRK